MKIPNVTRCDIKIVQFAISQDTVLCDIYFNATLLYKGIQNKNYPVPSGTYKAIPFKGEHKYTRLLLLNITGHYGVEIHEANLALQLHGCTAIGFDNKDGYCSDSVKALQSLMDKVRQYSVCYVQLVNNLTEPVNNAVL